MEQKSYAKEPVRFADCYVLSDNRGQAFILSFLRAFIPLWKEYLSAYPVPELADEPAITFTTADALLQYLEQQKEEPYALYWSNRDEDSPVRQAMCLFTSDGQVILGLSVLSLFPDASRERDYLEKLKASAGSETGLIEYAQPAARETADFLERVRKFGA